MEFLKKNDQQGLGPAQDKLWLKVKIFKGHFLFK